MIRLTLILLPMCFVILSAVTCATADEQPRPVRAVILADVSAVTPGEPFEAAVLLEMEPGWHVYWKNPGDSGLPTSVEFALPPGFTATELKWPLPSVLKGAGGLTDYGYEDSLLLSARVTTPKDIKLGSTVKITAGVKWVSCRDKCIPGRAELELSLPVSKSAEHVNTGLFSEWNDRLPVNYSGKAPPFETELKTVSKGDNEYSVVISLDPKEELKDIALYPAPGNSYIVGDIVLSEDRGKSAVSFDVNEVPSHDTRKKALDALIVYTGKDGKRSGYEFEVPLNR